MKPISIDLDWTLFDMQPLYEMAFRYGVRYYHPKNENVHKAYSAVHANQISALLATNLMYETPLIHSGIPQIIKRMLNTDLYSICYVSDRVIRDRNSTYKQLRGSGILCNITDVYDFNVSKAELLKSYIGSTLHFDDSPSAIENCLRNSIKCVLISGPKTPFNHKWRECVKWYPDIVSALECELLSNVR